MVLFNRFFTPDIDIDEITLTSGNILSTPLEQLETLRWIAIMSHKVSCDLAASTGIHSGKDVIKMLLAGATVTQVASTLYKNGPDQVTRILTTMEKWMNEKVTGFSWQSGYGWFGVSARDLDKAVAYVENQKEHHKIVSFQDELRKILTAYKIPYDEKYLWD